MDTSRMETFIRRYNGLYQETNGIYHSLARHFGLSDSAFFILYTLREAEGRVSQSQLCGELFLSKQTVNSALKQLEQEGYLTLENLPGSRRSKGIQVTARGEELLRRVADPVLALEARAYGHLTPQEREQVLELGEKLLRALRQEAQALLDRG